LCPAPISPKHIVKESPVSEQVSLFEGQKREKQKTAISFQRWQDASSSMFLGFLAANTLGHLSAFWLVASLFRPLRMLKSLSSKKINVNTSLSLLRLSEQESNRLFHGFSYDEMAERVFAVLNNMGMRQFSPLVMIIAHGSSSTNNPHFAAYDCGACSGKPGAPNARVFAMMANIPEVRKGVLAKGLEIPSSTFFVGAYHDTCTDNIDVFDVENLPKSHEANFMQLQELLNKARGLNAKERCRRFALVPLKITEEEALKEVNHRASVLFEPRPELGHATNALCVVGRRKITRNLFLDRRAFLNSYDPLLDGDGKILDHILSAVVPVCGGINLEYYFSRTDSAVYGCGTKLSHNVCSLLGVYNGIDDDLRTGLPVQMTEVHDPVRLLMVIEQNPQIVTQVLQSNAAVSEWVNHKWVQLACLHPQTLEMFVYDPAKGFTVFKKTFERLKTVKSSHEYASTSRDNLAVASVVK